MKVDPVRAPAGGGSGSSIRRRQGKGGEAAHVLPGHLLHNRTAGPAAGLTLGARLRRACIHHPAHDHDLATKMDGPARHCSQADGRARMKGDHA